MLQALRKLANEQLLVNGLSSNAVSDEMETWWMLLAGELKRSHALLFVLQKPSILLSYRQYKRRYC